MEDLFDYLSNNINKYINLDHNTKQMYLAAEVWSRFFAFSAVIRVLET
jgi:hypothetical protein